MATHATLRLLLGGALISSAAACDPGVFGDLEDQAWVVSTGTPDALDANDFGAALAFGGSGGSGLTFAAVGAAPPGLARISFAADGDADTSSAVAVRDVISFADSIDGTPAIAGDPGGFDGEEGNIALAISDSGQSYLYMVRARDFVAPMPFPLDAGPAASGVAFGATALGAADTDLVAVVGDRLHVVTDYQSRGSREGCVLPRAGLGVAVIDGLVAVGLGDSLLVTSAADVDGRPVDACDIATVAVTLEAPGGEDDFGTEIATGDVDGDGSADLIVAAPGSSAVYVYLGFDAESPADPVKVTPPGSPSSFGAALATGDLDGDGTDELIVGDPAAIVDGKTGAGRVSIFPGGDLTASIDVHDASPEGDQAFGRALTVGGFDDSEDVLVVGASDEVFTYFRTPLPGDTDVRR